MKPPWNNLKKLKGLFFGEKTGGRRKTGPLKGDVSMDKKKDEDVDLRDIGQREADLKKIILLSRFKKNLKHFEEITGKSYDMNIREFKTGPQKVPSALIFVDGMVDNSSLEHLLKVINVDTFITGIKDVDKGGIFDTISGRLLTSVDYRVVEDMDALYEGISLGETALLFDGTPKAILCETRGWKIRALSEPESETTIRGPRDGFIESLRVNTSLIRRRIRSPNLWIESIQLGSLTRTEVAVAYIKGLAGEEILEEVRSRLQRLDLDSILGSGYIEEMIRDHPFSVMPTIYRTERPDRVAAALLEGRVAIFTAGTSRVLMSRRIFPCFAGTRLTMRLFTAAFEFCAIFPLLPSLPGIYVAVLNIM